MAKFAVLLFSPAPADPMAMPEEEMAAHEAFGTKVDEAGAKIVDAFAVSASTEAKALRGKEVVDGTFHGGDKVLSGFFVLEAKDIDTAVEVAKHNPATWNGGVEIRPLLEFPEE